MKSSLISSLLLSAQIFSNSHADMGDAWEHKHTHPRLNPPITTPGIYLKGTLGGAIPASKFAVYYTNRAKPSVLFGAGAGYTFNENLSADFTVSHLYKFKYNGIAHRGFKQNLSTTVFMANGYYTFPTTTVSPYLAAGIGMASHNVGGKEVYAWSPTLRRVVHRRTEIGKTVNTFALQVGTGITFKVTDSFFLDLGYRYADLGTFHTTNRVRSELDGSITERTDAAPKSKLNTHLVQLSIIYKL